MHFKGKSQRVDLAEPMSIDCGPYYAGFRIMCILQEAGLVEEREQSLEMCDLYSAAPNTFVLLRSCISFAPLAFFPLFLSLWCFLSPCGHLLGASPSRSTNHFQCCSASLPPPSGIFPGLSFLSFIYLPFPLVSLSCLFCVCRCDWDFQSNCVKAILHCVNETSSPRILPFSWKECLLCYIMIICHS